MAILSTLKRQLEREEKRLRNYERDANFLHHMSYAGLSASQKREQSGLKRKLATAYKKIAKLKAQIAAAEAKQNPHQLRVQKIVAGRMVKGKFVRGNPLRGKDTKQYKSLKKRLDKLEHEHIVLDKAYRRARIKNDEKKKLQIERRQEEIRTKAKRLRDLLYQIDPMVPYED